MLLRWVLFGCVCVSQLQAEGGEAAGDAHVARILISKQVSKAIMKAVKYTTRNIEPKTAIKKII